jgi:hypothetical protein
MNKKIKLVDVVVNLLANEQVSLEVENENENWSGDGIRPKN